MNVSKLNSVSVILLATIACTACKKGNHAESSEPSQKVRVSLKKIEDIYQTKEQPAPAVKREESSSPTLADLASLKTCYGNFCRDYK